MTQTENKLNLKSFPEALDMVFVEGGRFWMGGEDKDASYREKPLHEVEISSFYIGKYPVTQVLWIAVMKNNPSFFNGIKRPVEMVSWLDCEKFLEKLFVYTGRKYRFLTEAEWEYAATGGKSGIDENGKKKYLFAGSDKLDEVGWFLGNSHGETKVVGQKYPNGLGIYDLSGNVNEWCIDWYGNEYYQNCFDKGLIQDPNGAESGVFRMFRGGSWHRNEQFCRVANRSNLVTGNRGPGIGFRFGLSS